jgi:hypothetical protein
METVGIEPTSAAAKTNGVYRYSRRFDLALQPPRPAGDAGEPSPFDFPWRSGQAAAVSPILMPVIPPLGLGWADTRYLATN